MVAGPAIHLHYGRKHSLMNPDSPRHPGRVVLPHGETQPSAPHPFTDPPPQHAGTKNRPADGRMLVVFNVRGCKVPGGWAFMG